MYAGTPVVPPGYFVEPYVTGLKNVQSLDISPGGDFGYEGQLFIGDSRPNGVIYRVPNKENKILFATGAQNQLLSMRFAPLGSTFDPKLYVTHGYDLYAYDSAGGRTHFANIHAFPWDIIFAPDERFRNNLFHADGWEPAGEAVREWQPDGTQTVLVYTQREETSGLAFGAGGEWGNDLYIAFVYSSRSGHPYSAISKVDPNGVMTNFVAPPEFGYTNQLTFDTTGYYRGNLFVSDFKHNVIFEVSHSGDISEFASGFSFSEHGDHRIATGDIRFGSDGSLYVADSGAGTVWRIAPILGELDHIEITGPNEVAENSTAQYKDTAYYTGGTVVDVTTWTEWSVEPNTFCSIDQNGKLTTEEIHDIEENIIVHAQYTSGDTTTVAQKAVSIFAICPSGTALQFDGRNDYVDCGNDPSLDITDEITIAAWVYPFDSGRIREFLGKANPDAYLLSIDNGTLKYALEGPVGWGWKSTGISVFANAWTHVTLTYDGSVIKAYTNGAEGYSSVAAGSLLTTSSNLVIGKSYVGWAGAFKGKIDEVAIYNRALSAEEIWASMHQRLVGDELNLVAYWNFDEGQGQDANDISGHGNDAQLGNSPGIDDSDPCWVDSEAPVGFCTLEGLVRRDLSGVFDAKLNILQELDEAMAQENIVLDMLNTHFKNRDFGTASKNDVVKAKQKIHTAIQHEVQAETNVHKSLNNLEEALEALDCDVQPHIQPEDPVLNSAMQADINGDRVIDYRDFAVLASYWLESYQLQ